MTPCIQNVDTHTFYARFTVLLNSLRKNFRILFGKFLVPVAIMAVLCKQRNLIDVRYILAKKRKMFVEILIAVIAVITDSLNLYIFIVQ